MSDLRCGEQTPAQRFLNQLEELGHHGGDCIEQDDEISLVERGSGSLYAATQPTRSVPSRWTRCAYRRSLCSPRAGRSSRSGIVDELEAAFDARHPLVEPVEAS